MTNVLPNYLAKSRPRLKFMNEIEIGHQIPNSKPKTIDSESSTITSVDSEITLPTESSSESSRNSDSECSSDSESSCDKEDDVMLSVTTDNDKSGPPNNGNQLISLETNSVNHYRVQQGEPHCVICLEPENTRTDLCSCGATYHEKCWNEWLKKDRSCPSCRKIQAPLISDMFMRSFIDNRNSISNTQPLVSRCYYLKLSLLFMILIFLFFYFLLILV